MFQGQFHHVRVSRTTDDSVSSLQALIALLCVALAPARQFMRMRGRVGTPRRWLAIFALAMLLPNAANAAPTITISPASLPAPNVGVLYTETLSASGGTAPYTFVLTGGSLPPGLHPFGATISGTPTQAGNYTATFTVTDIDSETTTESYTFAVPDPSSGIAVAPPADATLNTAYSQSLVASGGLAPYTFSFGSGTLPPGLGQAGGVISGTPTTLGTYDFVLDVTDSSDSGGALPGPYSKEVTVSITVQNTPPMAGAVSATVAYGSTANPISPYITGATATSVAIGAQPPHGVAMASGTSISYTPNAGYAGSDSFTYTATNSAGTSSVATVTITVGSPSIAISPSFLPLGTANAAYSQSLVASGGAAPYTHTVVAGTLPVGVGLNPNGTLSGSPTAAGSFNFTVLATDSSTGPSAPFGSSRTYTLTIAAPSLAISGVSPANGPIEGNTSVTITGTGFTGATAVTFGGAMAPSFTVINSTQITATTPAHVMGIVDISVTTPGGNADFTNGFTYGPPVPTIASVSPNSGLTAGGTLVTITGTGFTGATAVSFDGTAATGITVINDTTITATTPAHAAGAINVSVTTPGGNADFTNGFTYGPPTPTNTSVSPNNGPTNGGTSVTITGTGFTGATAVSFDGTAATGIIVINDTSITATTPAHAAGAVDVSVTAPGGTATRQSGFTYMSPTPTITSVSPNNGPTNGGTSVTITGTGFTGATAVSFDGTTATGITVINDTTITATTPAHPAGAIDVSITAPGGTVGLASSFTYMSPVLTIASVSPDSGPTAGGTLVTITGTGFAGATAVTFNGTAASGFTVVDNTTITATTPAHATGTGAVAITTAGGTASLSSGFTYAARPDPSLDPEVIGLLNAQAQSTQRFAKTQTSNFRDRLEQIHGDAGRRAGSWNVQLGTQQQQPMDSSPLGYAQETAPNNPADTTRPSDTAREPQPTDQATPTSSDLAFWAGGFVNFGTANDSRIKLEHTLVGVTGGVDYRFSPSFIAGFGLGYGRDAVDIGANGTKTDGEALSAAIYGSYHPESNVFVDGLLGYSALDFGSRRFVTSTGDFALGDRNGSQVFGSLSVGYEHKDVAWLLSPYGRIEAAWSQLGAFTETGAGPDNLAFGRQTMDMLAGVIGLRAQYSIPQPWGLLTTRGRLEYTHDFAGSSRASMSYADLGNGQPYGQEMDAFTKDSISIGLGLGADIGDGATVGFDYTTGLGFDGSTQAHNFALRLGASF